MGEAEGKIVGINVIIFNNEFEVGFGKIVGDGVIKKSYVDVGASVTFCVSFAFVAVVLKNKKITMVMICLNHNEEQNE